MNRRSGRRRLAEAAVGLLMIPLTALPIFLYVSRTGDGYLMYLRGRYALAAPGTPQLSDSQLELALAARRRLRELRGIPVLVYHGIGRSGSEGADAGYVVSRERFAEQMRTLRTAGYEPVTTGQLALYLEADPRSDDLAEEQVLALPRMPVLVTFDDGRADALIQADPILRDTGMRATMFVIGAKAKEGGFYYEKLETLAERAADDRWELGNHTFDLHDLETDEGGALSALVQPELGESLSAYRQRVARDLDEAQALLTEETGRAPVGFAYPFGDWGAEAQPGIAETLQDLLRTRFKVAFDQDGQNGWRPALPGDNPMHIHRLQVGDWSGGVLLAKLREGVERAQLVYEERGLGYRYSAVELAYAAARTACPEPRGEPVRSRGDLDDQKLIALTLSGGPSAVTPEILDLLDAQNAAATFFVSEAAVPGHERLLQRALVEGNEIGVTARGEADRDIEDSVDTTRSALRGATGDDPCLVRPDPWYLADRTAESAAQKGLTTVLWSVDSQDLGAETPDEIADSVLRQAEPGAIVVMHDGGDDRRHLTVEALPQIIAALKLGGFRLVTVSELLGAPKSQEPGCSEPCDPKQLPEERREFDRLLTTEDITEAAAAPLLSHADSPSGHSTKKPTQPGGSTKKPSQPGGDKPHHGDAPAAPGSPEVVAQPSKSKPSRGNDPLPSSDQPAGKGIGSDPTPPDPPEEPEGNHGTTGTPPGKGGTPPGHGGTPPGQAKKTGGPSGGGKGNGKKT